MEMPSKSELESKCTCKYCLWSTTQRGVLRCINGKQVDADAKCSLWEKGEKAKGKENA